MKLSDFHALYVNLDKDDERKEALEFDFKTHNIEFNRVKAIYGKHLKDPIKSAKIAKQLRVSPEKMTADWWLSRKNFRTMCTKKNAVLAKVGCYLSHLKAIQLALQLGLNKVLILEDDARIEDDFEFNIPDDCDIYYVGGYWWKQDEFQPINDENVEIDTDLVKIAGTYGYILPTRRVMIDVYNCLRSVFLEGKGRDKHKDWRDGKVRLRAQSVDIHYINYFQKFGKCYISNPPIVYTRPFDSNISDNRKRYNLLECQ